MDKCRESPAERERDTDDGNYQPELAAPGEQLAVLPWFVIVVKVVAKRLAIEHEAIWTHPIPKCMSPVPAGLYPRRQPHLGGRCLRPLAAALTKHRAGKDSSVTNLVSRRTRLKLARGSLLTSWARTTPAARGTFTHVMGSYRYIYRATVQDVDSVFAMRRGTQSPDQGASTDRR